MRLSDGLLKGECRYLKTKVYVSADRKQILDNIQTGQRLLQIEVAEKARIKDKQQGLYDLIILYYPNFLEFTFLVYFSIQSLCVRL